MRREYKPGDRFGHVIYLNDRIDPESGRKRLVVQCDCGRIYEVFEISRNPEWKCLRCANRERARNLTRDDLIGTTHGIWEVLSKTNERKNGTGILFECRCIKCGEVSLCDSSKILYNKGDHCSKCKPAYDFRIVDDYAIGILPSGDEFYIDAEDIDKVSSRWWYKKSGTSYVLSNQADGPKLRLHRFVMGLPPYEDCNHNLVVDHINRNPLDCRKENLRVVSQHMNCFNKGIRTDNTSGYTGVSKDRTGKYRAAITFNGKSISLGNDNNQEICAARYNYASELLFGEHIGQRNKAPTLTLRERKRVFDICKPYIEETKEVTHMGGFFSE